MLKDSYQKTICTVDIEVAKPVADVFAHVLDFANWWPEDFVGPALQAGSEFIFRIGDSHYSTNQVIEYVPNEKIAWITTSSRRSTDDFDWTGTKMIFELTPKGDGTVLTYTYDGVVLEDEYDRLQQICDVCIKKMFYEFVSSFSTQIEVAAPASFVFERITRDVAKWWGFDDLSGSTMKPGDEFVINHPGTHYSKQRLVEVIADKRVVWLVTDSTLSWLKDPEEWTDSKMIFELSANGEGTVLHFTHSGLTPDRESYARCSEGWNMIIQKNLAHLFIS
ncbi:MAG TPA: SRPBCC family protein [Puia sp.]|uniref:SRPBCC family protein n=1 Tax=Puia sp. TaxID=2045100 RepID=UPI002B7C6274|nr:SRPBCC family protein [Puia sp.]HVU94231.1 SRPBCC family protein [Puia sp.]